MANDYDVGYRKPPKSSQFAKGHSGNPKGRPKGSRNIATMFNQIARELINVTENGKTKTITRVEAIFHQMTNKALSGDPRVMREVIHLARLFEEEENNEPGAHEPSERDVAVLASIRRRMERMGGAPKEENTGIDDDPSETPDDDEYETEDDEPED